MDHGYCGIDEVQYFLGGIYLSRRFAFEGLINSKCHNRHSHLKYRQQASNEDK
jgi:hypothetical protein